MPPNAEAIPIPRLEAKVEDELEDEDLGILGVLGLDEYWDYSDYDSHRGEWDDSYYGSDVTEYYHRLYNLRRYGRSVITNDPWKPSRLREKSIASTYFWEDYHYDDEVEPFEFQIPPPPKRQHTDFRAYGYIEYFRYDGVIVRGADVRHVRPVEGKQRLNMDYYMKNFGQFAEPKYGRKREAKYSEIAAIPRRRLRQIRQLDPFGMDGCGLEYSYGKKRRWEFARLFQRNPQMFTTNDPTIQTILFESDDFDQNFIGTLSPFPLRHCNYFGGDTIRRMVWLDEEGALRVVENQKGWAQANNVFPMLPQIDGLASTAAAPKPRRPTRRERKAARRRRLAYGLDEQWEPVRLTYYVHTPRPTQKFLNSLRFRRFGHRSYEWRESRKPWGERPPPSVRMDYQLDGHRFDDIPADSVEDEWELEIPRRPMTLADFIVEKPNGRKDSVGSDQSYVLIDAETFEIIEL